MRQTHLVDQYTYVEIDEMSTPGGVGVVVPDVWIALWETECQRVEDGDG